MNRINRKTRRLLRWLEAVRRHRAARRPGIAFSAAVLLLLLASCGGKIPPTHYYKLHLPEPVVEPSGEGPDTAVIMTFRASEMLIRDKIVYRPNRQEVGFYEYHRWAEDPRTTLTHALLDQMRRRKTFRRVIIFDGRTKSDYVLRGRIERLEEVDFDNGVSVAVKLSLDLLDAETSEPLWQGSSTGKGEVEVGEVRNVVAKMSEAARASIDELASQLDSFVKSAGPRQASASPPRR